MIRPHKLFWCNSSCPSPSFSPPFALSSFTQTLIITSICPRITQLFLCFTPMPQHPQCWSTSAALLGGVCSANLNHTGWAHLWKQMSTGAGMLFLFRVEHLRMAFHHSSSSLPFLDTLHCSGPQQAGRQAGLAPTPRQEELLAAGGRGQEAETPGFTPCSVCCNISPSYRW